MLKTKNVETAGEGGSAEQRLARLMDSPLLARVVPHLPAETLQQLIRHRGLDACEEIVTSATAAQLNSLFDLDLWRAPQPGSDGEFDVDRFGEWLDALADMGDSQAARTVSTLDQQVVVNGLSRYVRVFDPGIFEPISQSDDERQDYREAFLDGGGRGLSCEISGYIIRARRTDAWDAIIALLIALDAEHNDYFHAVMEGCRSLSHSSPEEDGLDELLQERDQHFHDASGERERRLSQQGYATPADARAFLQMARTPRPSAPAGTATPNPIVAAYFRAADEPLHEPVDVPQPFSDSPAATLLLPGSAEFAGTNDVAETVAAVIELLTEAGVMPERPRALLGAAESDSQPTKHLRLHELMDDARHEGDIAFFERNRELAFLTNALIAGSSVQSRPFTPQEASEAVASICNLGLESPDFLAGDQVLITAFEAGWSLLHRDVHMFVANQLIAMLADLKSFDREFRQGLTAFRRKLIAQRDAGTPWLARESGEVLAMLDMTAWTAVRGLLNECPVVAATLSAILSGSIASVSPTDFEFISTAAEIEQIQVFMTKLPDLLLG